MENSDLQKIWKGVDSEISPKSKDELNRLLMAKANQTINKFLAIVIVSVSCCIGLIIWLILASVNRPDDTLFLINNVIIGIITICALAAGINNWIKLQDNRYDQPMKQWLEERIEHLSKNRKRPLARLYILLLPLLCIMITLSIHVYYEYMPFIEVLRAGESTAGLAAGITVGIITAFFVNMRLRKFTSANLEFLKELHRQISANN
jgi:hypothetical protein